MLAARRNDGSFAQTPGGQEVVLPAGWNRIETTWRATAGGGFLQVSVNGMPHAGLTALVNDQLRVDSVRWGYLGGATTSTGSLLQDSFISWQ